VRNWISWLLKESEGVTVLDKLLLFFVKFIYLSLRIILRVALGKKRRDRLALERGLCFGDFWNKFFSHLRLDNGKLLKFKMPKYSFEFYCRNNKDDFKVMTIHEDEILEHFLPKDGDIVVDIGAHIGLYTIISSKRVGPNGKVVAIEADPGNFEILNRNIQLNKLNNVIALNYAAYSREEQKLKLYLLSGKSGFTSYNTILSNFVKSDEKFVEVNANTLDYLLHQNGIDAVNWMKIDVEGAEFEVLKGATSTLSKSKDIALLIELHDINYDYRPKIEEFIKSYNFRIKFEKSYQENEIMHMIIKKSKIPQINKNIR
jgi:FkbM family methyltransferase